MSCQTTLQPLARFAVDAAIVFSDILIVATALGRECRMVAGKGPCFVEPLTIDDVPSLPAADDASVHEHLKQMMRTLTVTRHRLGGHVPLIGFAGGPWTLLAYMVEGAPSKTWAKARKWLYADRAAAHRVLTLLSDVIERYLTDQVAAGAQALQVFESNAGYLTRELAREFMLPYLCRIASGVRARCAERGLDRVPLFCFPKDAEYAVHELEASEFDVVSVEW